MGAPEVQKGAVGSPGDTDPQLPQGAAQTLNEAAGQTPSPDQGGQPAPLPQPQFAPKPFQGPASLPNESDNFLFGPTTRPNEHPATGAIGGVAGNPPANMGSWYPALRTANEDPETPVNVKELFKLVTAILSGQIS